MQIYQAPLEGLTTVTYRKVFRKHFSAIDKFFTPFLTATHTHSFQGRDRKEYKPFQENTVPQLMAKTADVFLPALKMMGEEGYTEVNLNAGCPAPTAVTKGRGAGMLADPALLDRFFEEVFEAKEADPSLPALSVKTRIGLTDPEEYKELTKVYNRYPFSEIIIHPRIRNEYYDGVPHRDIFLEMMQDLSAPMCYNGDIWTAEDARKLLAECPSLKRIMLGRSLIADPALPRVIQGGEPLRKEELIVYLDDLKESYREILYGDRDVLFKLVDVWHYVGRHFPGQEKKLKKIRRSRNLDEYQENVDQIMMEFEEAPSAQTIDQNEGRILL